MELLFWIGQIGWHLILIIGVFFVAFKMIDIEMKIDAIFDMLYETEDEIEDESDKKIKPHFSMDEFNERLKKIKKLQEEKNG